MLVTHGWMYRRMVLLLVVVIVMRLLTVVLLLVMLRIFVAHTHLHISVMALRAIHHYMLAMLVALTEHAVGIRSGLYGRP